MNAARWAEADTRERVAQIAADNAGYRQMFDAELGARLGALGRRTGQRHAAQQNLGVNLEAARADREALHRDLGASIDRLERARLRTAATVLETEGEVAEMKLREKALAEAAAIERVRWEGGAKRGAQSLAAEFGLPPSWWDR